MAEVLPLPVQSSGTITMLHSRPSSSDAFQGSSSQYQQSSRIGQSTRSVYNTTNTGYRGTSAAPVQPYAFSATPQPRLDPRSSSHGAIGGHRHGHSPSASASTTSSDVSSQPSGKDDSVMGSRDGSLINLSSTLPDLSLNIFDSPAKPSPDRYHRPNQKRQEPTNSPAKSASAAPFSRTSDVSSGTTASMAGQQVTQLQQSVDDTGVPRPGNSELAKRYRRRSLNHLETQDLPVAPVGRNTSPSPSPSATSTPTTIRPDTLHARTASDESAKESTAALGRDKAAPASGHKAVNVPPRGSSDANKRINTPSPLSRQAVETEEEPSSSAGSPEKPKTYAAAARAGMNSESLAAQHLAAVSDRDLNKGMKSRLRRAFSFGSAQQLRQGAVPPSGVQPTREQHQQSIDDELDAEQQEIARRQEAGGIGAGIYSGQGGFTGSTDNLSISSTASSASMMLRKMGQGAKKGARSIKGLFRPKSVIGVPAADGPIQVQNNKANGQPSMAQVSMVTAEAERLKVNVNADPSEKHHGITGFPKLERNSLDAANITSLQARGSADGSDSRRSIVGSDKDRAEVLAAVKKGILKRPGTASPSGSPVIKPADNAAAISESPASSVPSTPKDGQARPAFLNGGVNGDYFSARMASLTKSMPNTPNGTSRSISFSPRIQFHDAWSSSEYDRRGDIATCNRLTPMLAQQIKEELNTFKMV